MVNTKKSLSIQKGCRKRKTNYKTIDEIVGEIGKNRLFRKTKNTVENNEFHRNESVYNHTLKMVKEITNLLDLGFITNEGTKKIIRSYFNQKIGRYKRHQLLVISAYLHDIGKTQTILTDSNGATTCTEHEKVGAKMAREILRQLGLKDDETSYVSSLIKLHSGFSLRFLSYLMTLSGGKLKHSMRKTFLLPEIFIYMVADNGSYPSFRIYRDFILQKLLQNSEIYQLSYRAETCEKELLDKIRFHLRLTSRPWPLDIRLLHLVEEVGELQDIYLQYLGAKERKQDLGDLANALNDIMFEVIALYDLLDLDILEELERELNKENE